jgi:NADH dehydrogenase (ubiquinone) 1 alpha subcomplex subunit 9
VHTKGAQRIARIAAQAGVPRFVHLSHLNASHSSKSKFYRAKAEGEELVKEAFPNATIIRPAGMYGFEDKLLTNLACMFSVATLFLNSSLIMVLRLANVVASKWRRD